MASGWAPIINLSNGIIGVSILTMPFCLKQCGIIFGTCVLIGTCILTRISCNLLMKAAYAAQKNSYESLAFYAFGSLGKMMVEILLILYTKGTLIAFFVVIGDLGPMVVAEFLGMTEYNGELRIVVMVAVAFLVILPLSLIKRLDGLNHISSVAVFFYGVLVVRLFLESAPVLFSFSWFSQVNWWRPSGLIHTLPIFALSLSCQTQLFVIANEIAGWNPSKMASVTDGALTLCSSIYCAVGILGYVAFYDSNIGGDVLLLLSGSPATQLIKLAFLFSVAVSYPLMIFPCRAAIYSMISARNSLSNDVINIPATPLRLITVSLIVFNLLVGIWIPNIELILALCGSLIGSFICFVVPGLLFLNVSAKTDSVYRRYALATVAIGLIILVVCSYVSLRDAVLHSASANQHVDTLIETPSLHVDVTDAFKVNEPQGLPVAKQSLASMIHEKLADSENVQLLKKRSIDYKASVLDDLSENGSFQGASENNSRIAIDLPAFPEQRPD